MFVSDSAVAAGVLGQSERLPADFQNGVKLNKDDLGNFGSGDGAKFQFLSKYSPAFMPSLPELVCAICGSIGDRSTEATSN